MATFTAYKAIDFSTVRLPNGGVFTSHTGNTTEHHYFIDGDDFLTYTGTGLGAIKDGPAYEPKYQTLSEVSLTTQGSLRFTIEAISALPLPDRPIYELGYEYGADIGTLYGLPAYLAWWLRYNDTLNGSEASDRLRGYDGNDIVNGNGGNDVLEGNRGSDTLFGGEDDDTLIGGIGRNILDGGEGSDIARYDFAEYGVTVDLSVTTAQSVNAVVSVAIDTLISIENLSGSDYADSLTGNESNNRLVGADGNDMLDGGDGNDKLIGQNGRDTLVGGEGQDNFVFASDLETTGPDIIKDFAIGEDSIVLDNAIFKRLDAGELKVGNFRANASGMATEINDYVIYEIDSGRIYYDPDGNGSKLKVQIAFVSGHPDLMNTDFFVV